VKGAWHVKSGRIGRVVQILTTLQAARGYGPDELAKIFGTSRRTVFRDLKELQAIGVPYHYDPKKGSYTLDPEFFLPPIDLNLQEALSLLILVHKFGAQTQIPFRKSALLAGLKIENNLPARLKQYCKTALQSISTRTSAQAPMSRLDGVFADLQKAITGKKIVHIRYQSLFEDQAIELDLHPCHLLYNHRAWYVLGFSQMHKSVRTFKLSRIIQMTTLEKCFVEADLFDIYEYFGRAWSMIPEGRLHDVKLRFLPKVAQNVTEVHWHTTQKVQFDEDGSALLEFRVDGLGEIFWWVLGYGDQVQVLAPKALRDRIIWAAENMIKLNRNL